MCLLANTSNDKPSHLNKSLICLPMKTPGIVLDKKIDKMGMRSSDTAIIHFDNVRIPADHIIGDEGMGFTYQMMQVKIKDFTIHQMSSFLWVVIVVFHSNEG